MKKILLTVFSLLILIGSAFATTPMYSITLNGVNLVNPPTPVNWYVTQAGAGNKSGTSQANAFAITNIGWLSINPGDSVYLCGTIYKTAPLNLTKSGVSGYPIYVRGDCPGNAGILDDAPIFSGTWTLVSSNVYSITPPNAVIPSGYGLVIQDDAPLNAIHWNTNAATTIAAMVAFGNGSWSYDSTNNILYVLTTAADTPSNHVMQETYNTTQYTNLMNSSNISYLTIENLTIKNMGAYGLDLVGGSNINIANNTIYNSSNWAIFTNGITNINIYGNTLYNTCWLVAPPLAGNDVGEGVRFYSDTGGSFYNNTLYNSQSIGLDLYGNATKASTGISVYGNTFYNGQGQAIYSDDSNSNFIYNNLMYNNGLGNGGNSGIFLNSETANGETSNTYVYNNVCIASVSGAGGDCMIVGDANFNSPHSPNSFNNFIYNNTFVNPNGSYSVLINGSNGDIFQNNIVFGVIQEYQLNNVFVANDYDYNTYLGTLNQYDGSSYNNLTLAQWGTALGGESHSVYTNSTSSTTLNNTFVNAVLTSSVNLQLESGASLPVGVGANLTNIYIPLRQDFSGTTRPSIGAWDDGAYNNQ